MLSLVTAMTSLPKMVLVKPCLWMAEGLTPLVLHRALVRLEHSWGVGLLSHLNKKWYFRRNFRRILHFIGLEKMEWRRKRREYDPLALCRHQKMVLSYSWNISAMSHSKIFVRRKSMKS